MLLLPLVSTVVLQHVLILTRVCSVCAGATGATATATALAPAYALINIHNVLYCWDAVKETHMTERGWTGIRYTIVLYNTGGRQAVADLNKGFLSVAQTPEVQTARTIALAVLDTTLFSKDRSDSSKSAFHGEIDIPRGNR